MPVWKIFRHCISIPFHLSLVIVGMYRRQPEAVLRGTLWTVRWYHRRAGHLQDLLFPLTGECCILEDEILLQQKSTRPLAEYFSIYILLFNLILCCTDKLVVPLPNHVAVGKDACPRRLWLVSWPQPAAPVMLSESKTGTGHLLLYQLLSNRDHLFITKEHI